jgi:hypothetical protein
MLVHTCSGSVQAKRISGAFSERLPQASRNHFWRIVALALCVTAFALPAAAQTRPKASPSALPAGSAAPATERPQAGVASLSDSLVGEAKQEYESAKLLYNDGDYAGALLKFQRAHMLSKDPRLLWNMAVCEKQQRHYAQVLVWTQRYLAEGAAMMSADDRREATELVNVVQTFVSPLWVVCDEPDAEVWLDGVRIGTTPMTQPVIVDMGSRQVRVRKPGFREVTQAVEAAGSGKELRVAVKLEAIKHEGRLEIVARPGDDIWVDGRLVGRGRWEGPVSTGEHALRVSAPGMQDHESRVAVADGELRQLRVALDAAPVAPAATASPPEDGGFSRTWWYVGGAAILTAGAVVGGYFLLRPDEEPAPKPVPGTIDPGTIQMPLRTW